MSQPFGQNVRESPKPPTKMPEKHRILPKPKKALKTIGTGEQSALAAAFLAKVCSPIQWTLQVEKSNYISM